MSGETKVTKSKITKKIKDNVKKQVHSLDSIINTTRDILRTEGITGMSSVNHCIVFVVARFIDDEFCEKTGIDKMYTYENMLLNDDGKSEIGAQELYDRFCVIDEDEEDGSCFMVEIMENYHRCEKCRKILCHEKCPKK